MVVTVKMATLLGHFLGIVQIALAQVPLAGAGLIHANNTTARRSPLILDHFTDALLAELHLDAFLAILVLLADNIFLLVQKNSQWKCKFSENKWLLNNIPKGSTGRP